MADMHAILVGLLSVSHTPEQADHAAKEVLDQHAHELAQKILAYKRPEKPACRTTQHCAYHGWCHRCDPERAGMDRAARLIKPKKD